MLSFCFTINSIMTGDNLHQNSDESIPRVTKLPEDEEYPPLKTVIPALAAAYLVVFLVALVCLQAMLENCS